MKKLEFSKFILYVLYLTAVSFTLLTGYVALQGGDAASVANIVLAIWGSVSVGVGFYYWKAKAENTIKISSKIPPAVLEKINDVGEFLE